MGKFMIYWAITLLCMGFFVLGLYGGYLTDNEPVEWYRWVITGTITFIVLRRVIKYIKK